MLGRRNSESARKLAYVSKPLARKQIQRLFVK